MKFAPVLASGTLALLVLAMSTAKAPNPPEIEQPIDVAGVRTLEVRTENAIEIRIAEGKPHLKYNDNEDSVVKTRRLGDRFVVDANLATWEKFEVVVPPGIGRFVIDQGAIGTKLKVGEIEILSPGDVSWHGDARLVVLRDTSDPSKHRDDGKNGKHEDCDCQQHSTLTVGGGRIGEVRAHSPHATLRVVDADRVGVAYAWLGPKGNVTIDTARNFQQIHLMKEGDEAPAGAVAPRPVETAAPAADAVPRAD